MLKEGVVLIVICLVVVGGLAVWWTQHPFHPAGAVPVAEAPAVTPPPPPVVAKTILPPKLEPVVERTIVESQPEVPAAPVAQTPVAPPVIPPPPFPAVEQIATGAQGGAITGKYGDPALTAVTSAGGHVVETFVYARGRGHTATVIRLEDGKVSSAYSQAEPVTPPGLSAPRR